MASTEDYLARRAELDAGELNRRFLRAARSRRCSATASGTAPGPGGRRPGGRADHVRKRPPCVRPAALTGDYQDGYAWLFDGIPPEDLTTFVSVACAVMDRIRTIEC